MWAINRQYIHTGANKLVDASARTPTEIFSKKYSETEELSAPWGGYGLKLASRGAAVRLCLSLVPHFCCTSLPAEKALGVVRKIVNGNKQPPELTIPEAQV